MKIRIRRDLFASCDECGSNTAEKGESGIHDVEILNDHGCQLARLFLCSKDFRQLRRKLAREAVAL